MPELGLVLNQLFNGFSVASLYLLAALGLALSFGLMRVINMAHGEMLMLGGYLAFITMSIVPGGAGVLLALPVAFLGAAFFGALLQVMLVRRLMDRPLDTLLATWGVSLILQQAARDLFGAIGVDVIAPGWLTGSTTIGAVVLPSARLFIVGVAVFTLLGLALVMTRTRVGLHVRAVNQDRAMASACGIDTQRVDLIVFALGTGIAGVAGVVLALLGPVTPTVGQSYIVPAFLVVIMGGMGSVTGTTIAALLLGLVSALAQLFTDVSTATVLLLVFVILFLQIRPRGVIAPRSRVLDV